MSLTGQKIDKAYPHLVALVIIERTGLPEELAARYDAKSPTESYTHGNGKTMR
jgi:hypothetical protein